ncbi:MAG: helix-turn-helix domain-containing protein [Gilvibacter sp.]
MIYVNIIGITVLSIFGLFVITKKAKILSDYLLLLVITLFTGILITGIFLEQKPSSIGYFFFLFCNSFIFPSLVIYGLVLLDRSHKFKLKWLWTASYAIVFIVFIGVDTLLLNTYETPQEISRLIEQPTMVYNLLYKGQYIFVIATLIWLLSKLNTYKRSIKNTFSTIDSIHLNWFRNFTYTYLGVNIASLLLFVLLDLGWVSTIFIPLLIEHIILVLSLFYLCFHGIKQYSLAQFKSHQLIENQGNDNQKITQKYSSSSLSDDEMRQLFSKIEQLFVKDRVYLDAELNIDAIANQLNVTTHRVSQTINSMASKPFYDYVNAFRVTHLKRLLQDPNNKRFTILALGIESGFNSKATLNRVFKQQVGMTPKGFQKTQFTI